MRPQPTISVPSKRRGADSLGPTCQRPETAGLAETGTYFHQRGWSLGTSSNYSVVLNREPLRLLVTASGKDKGRLRADDFVIVNETGRSVNSDAPRPSAETPLHVMLAGRPSVGSVLHTHSIWGTILSDLHHGDGKLTVRGYEMLKGLAGIGTHETTLELPIFDNTQDIPELVGRVEPWLDDSATGPRHGFLIHRHGLYTWGRDLDEARRHVEVLEFLFEVVGRTDVGK